MSQRQVHPGSRFQRSHHNRHLKRVKRINWLGQLPRIVIIGVALLCLILGFWGFSIYARTPNFPQEWQTGRLEFLYYTLQLFVGASGPVSGAADMAYVPWQLQVARLLAPAAAVVGAIAAMLAIFDEAIRRAYRRSRRGHAVVVGDTPDAEVIEDALKAEDVPVETADSGSYHDLVAAGAHGAAAVYICTDDTGDPGGNLRIAATVRDIKPKLKNRVIAAAVRDPELAPAMLARNIVHPIPGVDLFTIDNLAAARLAAHTIKPGVRSIWLLGSGHLHDELLYELVQVWAAQRQATDQLAIAVGGDDAQLRIDNACARLPQALLTNVKLHAVADFSAEPLPDVTVICGKDDAETLELALTTPKAWQGKPGSLIIQVTRSDQAQALFGEGIGVPGNAEDVLDVVTTGQLIQPLHGGLLVHQSAGDRLREVADRTNKQHGYPGLAMDQVLPAIEQAGFKVVPFAASAGLVLDDAAVGKLVASLPGTGLPAGDLRQQVAALPEALAQMGLGIADVSQAHAPALISSATPKLPPTHPGQAPAQSRPMSQVADRQRTVKAPLTHRC